MLVVIVVLALLSLVALAGWIMVVVAAFRSSVLWGVGALLLFPVWLVFVIVHWSEAKNGFLIYLGSTAVAIGLAFMSGSVTLLPAMRGGDEVAVQLDGDPDLREEGEEAEGGAAQEGETASTYDTGSSAEPERSASASEQTGGSEEKQIAYSYQDVELSELSSAFVGTPIIVTTIDGQTHKGKLLEVIPHRITIQQKIGSGTFEFDLVEKRIQRVQLLRAESR